MATSKERGLTSQLKKSADKRFSEQESSHRPPGSQPSDYGYSTPSITRFSQHTSSHHTSESADSDYGYNVVANSQQLSYYAPHKDNISQHNEKTIKPKDTKVPSSRNDLIAHLNRLSEDELRPYFEVAARQIEGQHHEKLGIERLRDRPPSARWATRRGTPDEALTPKAFIEKHYGEFLDGTVGRRDVEEYDARLVRAFRTMSIEEQNKLKLPLGGEAYAATCDYYLNLVAAGRNGPIPVEQIKRFVYALNKQDRKIQNG